VTDAGHPAGDPVERAAVGAARTGHALVGRVARYEVVLALIVTTYLLAAALPSTDVTQALVVALQAATFLFTLLASRPSRPVAVVGGVMAALAVVVAVTGSALLPDAQALTALLGVGLLTLALGALLVQLAGRHRAPRELVLGAVDGYLLIGLLFAFVFAAFGSQQGSWASDAAAEITNGDFLIFSYASLTTLGGAPLVPQSTVVLTFAVLEAIVGQLFLVTVIARLVALWASPPPAV
jgi:hypothetical protein